MTAGSCSPCASRSLFDDQSSSRRSRRRDIAVLLVVGIETCSSNKVVGKVVVEFGVGVLFDQVGREELVADRAADVFDVFFCFVVVIVFGLIAVGRTR